MPSAKPALSALLSYCHHGAALFAVRFSVGRHGALIHRPGGFELGMSIGGESAG